MIQGIIPFAHQLLKNSVHEGDTVIDATCGNGNDTLFLAKLVGKEGHVYAVDVQEQAIKTTKNLLEQHHCNYITYIHDNHANIKQFLPNELYGTIGGVVFNLGYLPKSDKQIITKGSTTVEAIKTLIKYIRKHALIVIVIYHGHEGGKEEKEMVLSFVKELDQSYYSVLKYEFINQINNPPFIIAIQKKK